MGVIKKLLTIIPVLSTTIVSGQQYHYDHEYVDMGLSVKWAATNLGAGSPEEYGDYYAWGEVEPKMSYTESNYLFIGSTGYGLPKFTKYVLNEQYGVPDGRQCLEPADDAATNKWSNDWRIPTKEEIEELVDNCDWNFSPLNGVMGCWAISKKNGNRLFFPLAGSISNEPYNIGHNGVYISSCMRQNMNFEVYEISLSYDDSLADYYGKPTVVVSKAYREIGHSIRPVFK